MIGWYTAARERGKWLAKHPAYPGEPKLFGESGWAHAPRRRR